MRTIGPAWVAPIPKHKNVYIEQDESRQRAKHMSASWRQSWRVRAANAGSANEREKDQLGALNDREAVVRAKALILAREQERDELHAKLARAGDPRSFGALADKWLAEKRAEVKDGTLRPSTMYDYAGMLARPAEAKGNRWPPHARIMREFGDRSPRSITRDEIKDFLKGLRDEHGLSERTRAKYAVVLGMIFAFALEEGWIDVDPMANRKREKRAKHNRKALTIYSIEQVEAIAREAAKTNAQDGEIIRLASYTGLRQGELLALKWRDVDWTGGILRVEASWDHRTGTEGLPKSGQARVVPLGDPAAEVLERVSKREEKTKRTDLVFPGERSEHLDETALYRGYVKARDKVCEQDGDLPKIVFHGLRHTLDPCSRRAACRL